MELFYRRHPEIGMGFELTVKPRRSCFLCPNAQEIRTDFPRAAVGVISVTVVAVTVVTVGMVTVGMVTVSMATITVAGFEWPSPTHGP